MVNHGRQWIVAVLFALALAGQTFGQPDQADPLSSWNEGPAKKAILDFVRVTADKAGSNYVPPEQRVATFDQDGTLWVEHPMYTPTGEHRGEGSSLE